MKQSEGSQIELSSLKTERGNFGSGGSANTDSFNPDDYESIRLRRMFGYLIDVVCIAIVTFVATIAANILGVLSFGTLTPLLVLILALIPVLYNTILIGGSQNATFGMRFMNVKMELLDGRDPDYLTAFIHAVLFYLSIALTSSLILLISLFNPRGRCLHDYIVGVVIRRTALS